MTPSAPLLRLQEVLPDAYTVLHEEVAPLRHEACNFYLLERRRDGARGVIHLENSLFLPRTEGSPSALLQEEVAVALDLLEDPLPYEAGWRTPAAFAGWLQDPQGLRSTFLAHMDYGNVFVDDVVKAYS